jgi:hypothetical protein
MKKETFFELHEILREELEKHFFPKRGGTRDIYDNPCYLVKT